MKTEIINIDILINQILDLPERQNCFLYTSSDFLARGDTVLLVDDDDYDAPDEINGYVCNLSWASIKDIAINLLSQLPNPTLEDYIEAINYYIENDAFIDKENPDNNPQGGYKIWESGPINKE